MRGGRAPHLVRGREAEEAAARYLERLGLRVVQRNVRYRLGEIDIVARDGATWVFVEVRRRARLGDAAASIDARKRGRIRRAAQLYLQERFRGGWPACRFDVVLVEDGALQWLPAAFTEQEA